MGQLSAVTGRRIKPNHVDIINQQTGYLPALYRNRSEREHRDKMFGLEKDSMAQAEAAARRNEGLYAKDLDERKKQAKKAQRLGWINTGISGLSALGNVYNAFDKEPAKSAPALSSVIPKTTWGSMAKAGPMGLSSMTPGGVSANSARAATNAASSALSGGGSSSLFGAGSGSGLTDIFDVGKSIFNKITGWF